jgi:hypothetical protein
MEALKRNITEIERIIWGFIGQHDNTKGNTAIKRYSRDGTDTNPVTIVPGSDKNGSPVRFTFTTPGQ